MKMNRNNIWIKMKKKAATILLFLISFALASVGAYAEGTETQGQTTSSQLVLVVVLSVSVLVLLVLCYILYVLNVFLKKLKNEGALQETPAIFRFTDAVPMEREHEILLDHSYDGIRELDNKLPPWWVYMFYGTVVFSVVYMWYYHIYGTGNIQEEEYQAEMAYAEIQMKMYASSIDENSVTLLSDEVKLKSGEAIYQSNCAACHGKLGEGGVGPNLTDNYWIHGGTINEIFKTVKYGVPTKGMIPWQAQLSPAQMQEVSSFIMTMKGTNPPNQKEAQGELVE
jgi:cytochrome c oxidase cbb3-type subunit 3